MHNIMIIYVYIYIYIYMLGAKYGFAFHGSVLRATIHGSRVSKGAKYKFADNPWIALHKQLIAQFARRSSPRINYRSVSGVALASLCKPCTCTD